MSRLCSVSSLGASLLRLPSVDVKCHGVPLQMILITEKMRKGPLGVSSGLFKGFPPIKEIGNFITKVPNPLVFQISTPTLAPALVRVAGGISTGSRWPFVHSQVWDRMGEAALQKKHVLLE